MSAFLHRASHCAVLTHSTKASFCPWYQRADVPRSFGLQTAPFLAVWLSPSFREGATAAIGPLLKHDLTEAEEVWPKPLKNLGSENSESWFLNSSPCHDGLQITAFFVGFPGNVFCQPKASRVLCYSDLCGGWKGPLGPQSPAAISRPNAGTLLKGG